MPSSGVSVDPLLLSGPIFMGVFGSSFFFGVYLTQLYNYLSYQPPASRGNGDGRSKKDPIALRVLIIIVTILECLSLGMVTDNGWLILVSSTGPKSSLGSSNRTGAAIPPTTALNSNMVNSSDVVSLCMQCFFAWRIWVLRTSRVEPVVSGTIVTLSSTQLAAGFVVMAQFVKAEYDIAKLTRFSYSSAIYLCANLACDVVITVTLFLMLRRYKLQTKLRSTRNVLDSLSRLTIENGLVLTVCVALALGFFFARPNDMVYMTFHWITGRIYANVLLASVNNRSKHQQQVEGTAIISGLNCVEFKSESGFESSGVANGVTNTSSTGIIARGAASDTHSVGLPSTAGVHNSDLEYGQSWILAKSDKVSLDSSRNRKLPAIKQTYSAPDRKTESTLSISVRLGLGSEEECWFRPSTSTAACQGFGSSYPTNLWNRWKL
ncbi:hypothetical protein FA15DRAFT_696369 [Coprinopsis marcescibilis]|uniref:DUF6534 domain-containing protein n=1 Tax=Coprinopsis marcescibilis TaxID=230819 RepID=A0A5C3KMH4_COPMA|nr:hypothetical protein FA15DRAFT_696369 [Coprinopsis marcescibilis]